MKIQFLKSLNKFFVGLAVVSVLGASPVWAETAEEKGLAISARADQSDLGFGDSVSDMEMVLKNSHGQETNRIMKNMILEIPDAAFGDRSITVFTAPSDIAGTALLSHAKILDPDDQWLYLPALKRIKRISSVNKSGPFVGSEFAFEDFTSLETGKYDYKYIKEEACGDMMCDVVERYPRYKYSGYTKQISWIDQKVFQVRKIEFYDRRGELLKILSFSGYKKYAGNVWRAHKLHMENVQTNKSTDLLYSNFEFKTGLSKKDFEKGILTRVR